MDPTVATLKQCVRFLGHTDARDKVVKFLQNWCKNRKYYASGSRRDVLAGLQGTFSDFRSIIKLGKQIDSVHSGNQVLTRG